MSCRCRMNTVHYALAQVGGKTSQCMLHNGGVHSALMMHNHYNTESRQQFGYCGVYH